MAKPISEMERDTRYRFKTKDCPTANGRPPQPGESMYRLYFPLDEGGYLRVEMGEEGLRNFAAFLEQERAELDQEDK